MPATTNSYRLSPSARDDLEGLWLYTYQNWSRQQADAYHADIIEAFEKLAKNPKIGRSVDYLRRGYLRYSIGSHYIFYQQKSTGMIEIIRVLHQRMDFGRHL
tara:strand:+ start:108 stop:413 length:306 start_codon:yes stop_codon:yes gene_type:complete